MLPVAASGLTQVKAAVAQFPIFASDSCTDRKTMLTLSDCLGLCDLTEEEVEAIREHEHVPMIIAAALGHYLVHQPSGAHGLAKMIVDDIRRAQAAGDARERAKLRLVLRHFLAEHGTSVEEAAFASGSARPAAAASSAKG